MIDAIYKLYPQVVCTRNDIAYDADGNEVAYDKDAVQAYVDAHAYIAKRASEYPSITDFADAYYWAQKGNTALMDAYVAKCDAIKLKYPK
jgi:beta-galactosidase GanA